VCPAVVTQACLIYRPKQKTGQSRGDFVSGHTSILDGGARMSGLRQLDQGSPYTGSPHPGITYKSFCSFVRICCPSNSLPSLGLSPAVSRDWHCSCTLDCGMSFWGKGCSTHYTPTIQWSLPRFVPMKGWHAFPYLTAIFLPLPDFYCHIQLPLSSFCSTSPGLVNWRKPSPFSLHSRSVPPSHQFLFSSTWPKTVSPLHLSTRFL
jgi:hypothetical protein